MKEIKEEKLGKSYMDKDGMKKRSFTIFIDSIREAKIKKLKEKLEFGSKSSAGRFVFDLGIAILESLIEREKEVKEIKIVYTDETEERIRIAFPEKKV